LRCAGSSLLLITLLALYTRSVSAAEAVEPFDQVKRLGRGVNILGYDPLWKSFEKGVSRPCGSTCMPFSS
jgi:hypothetical protein